MYNKCKLRLQYTNASTSYRTRLKVYQNQINTSSYFQILPVTFQNILALSFSKFQLVFYKIHLYLRRQPRPIFQMCTTNCSAKRRILGCQAVLLIQRTRQEMRQVNRINQSTSRTTCLSTNPRQAQKALELVPQTKLTLSINSPEVPQRTHKHTHDTWLLKVKVGVCLCTNMWTSGEAQQGVYFIEKIKGPNVLRYWHIPISHPALSLFLSFL